MKTLSRNKNKIILLATVFILSLLLVSLIFMNNKTPKTAYAEEVIYGAEVEPWESKDVPADDRSYSVYLGESVGSCYSARLNLSSRASIDYYYILTKDPYAFTKLTRMCYKDVIPAYNHFYDFVDVETEEQLRPDYLYNYDNINDLLNDVLTDDYIIRCSSAYFYNFSFNDFPKGYYGFAVEMEKRQVGCKCTMPYSHTVDTFFTGIVVRNITTNYVVLNEDNKISNDYIDRLKNNRYINGGIEGLSTEQIAFIERSEGIYQPFNTDGKVTLHYYGLNDKNVIVEKVETKHGNAFYLPNKSYCASLFNLDDADFNRFKYNVVREQKSVKFDDRESQITDRRVILEPYANGEDPNTGDKTKTYSFYEYGAEEGKDTYGATTRNIKINYPQFQAKDLCLSVVSNADDYERIVFDLYTTRFGNNHDGKGDFIDWNFNDIITILNNRMDWNVEFTNECFFPGAKSDIEEDTSNFLVNCDFDYELGYYEESTSLYCTFATKTEILNAIQNKSFSNFGVEGKEATVFRLFFNESIEEQPKMFNTSIKLYCKIAPDYFWDVKILYKNFDMNTSNSFELSNNYATPIIYTYSDNEHAIKRSVIASVDFACDGGDFSPLVSGLSGYNYFPANPEILTAIPNELKDLISIKSIMCSYKTEPIIKNQQRVLFDAGYEFSDSIGLCTIVVDYEIKSFFGITTKTITDGITKIDYSFIPYNDYNQKCIGGKTLLQDIEIDNNHRLESLSINSFFINPDFCRYDKINPINNFFELKEGINYEDDEIYIPVEVVISDEFLLNFDFFARYYDAKENVTPFATLVSAKNVKVKVKDISAVDEEGNKTFVPTSNEFCMALKNDDRYKGLDFGQYELQFMGSRGVGIDKQAVKITKAENGVFTYDVPYSYRSVVYRNSKGERSEVPVKMTNYRDWSNSFNGGAEWGVEMLNKKELSWKLENGAIYPDQLYGLFASVVYESQNKDLTSLFADLGTDGTYCEFTTKEVKGSDIYKFVENNKAGLVVAGAVGGFAVGGFVGALAGAVIAGYVVPSVMEIANDDNATYYTHYFYIDGSSDIPYIGDNGGKDAGDERSAIETKIGDLAEKTRGLWEKVKPYVCAILLLIGTLLLVIFGWKLIAKASRNHDVGLKIILIISIVAICGLALFFWCKLLFPAVLLLF